MIYKPLIFLHLSMIHQESTQKNLQANLLFFFLGNTGRIDKNSELNQTNPAPATPVQLCHGKGRVWGQSSRLYIDFHPHKSREHLYHTISISLSNTYEIKLLNEAHVTVLPWIKSKEENENELCYNKDRQLSSRKKKLRRMNEWMYKWKSFLIKGYLTHRNKQKYVRGVRSNPSLIKVYPDYSAGKAAF